VQRDWIDSVRRALDGDREAFSWLVDRFKGPICASIHPIVRDWHKTQDVAQEAFAAAFAQLDELREPENFRAWLHRIALNHAVNWTRRRPPRRAVSLDMLQEEEVVGTIAGRSCTITIDGKRSRSTQALLGRVRSVVSALPNGYGSVLAMRYVEELSLEEIAMVLDCSPSAVKSALYRARVMARDVLRRSGLDIEGILYEM